MEFLRARRIAHAIDLNHDEPQFRQRLRIAARRRKTAAAHAAGLRARINVVDDRILLRRIEVGGDEHQAVHIRLAVARLHAVTEPAVSSPRPAASKYPPFRASLISLPVASRTTATGGTSGFE